MMAKRKVRPKRKKKKSLMPGKILQKRKPMRLHLVIFLVFITNQQYICIMSTDPLMNTLGSAQGVRLLPVCMCEDVCTARRLHCR